MYTGICVSSTLFSVLSEIEKGTAADAPVPDGLHAVRKITAVLHLRH